MPASAARPVTTAADVLVWTLAGLLLVGALGIAGVLPVVNGWDELAHYSLVRSFAAAPRLLPAHGESAILAGDLVSWSGETNYLAHPPLYYLLAAPISALAPGDPLPVRLFGAVLATAGLVLSAKALLARFAESNARILAVLLVFGLPDVLQIAGRVSNDDLMLFEIGLFAVATLAPDRRPRLALAAFVALGWTKVTGFYAAGLFLALLHLADVAAGRAPLLGREGAGLTLAALLGAAPSLAAWGLLGAPIWVPPHFPDWFEHASADELRAWTFLDYARWFGTELGRRFSYHLELTRPDLGLHVALLAALVGLALAPGRRADPLPRLAALTVAVFAATLLVWGWRSFSTQGIFSEAQPRYFLAVWPLVACAATTSVERIAARLPSGPARVVEIAAIGWIALVASPLFLVVAWSLGL